MHRDTWLLQKTQPVQSPPRMAMMASPNVGQVFQDHRIAAARGRLKLSGSVLVAATVAAIMWASAGQLDPPAGAIQPTGPITINGADVNNNLPYVISQPGSYILTSDITAPGRG